MPGYVVKTPQRTYSAMVERGIAGKLEDYLPAGSGKIFVVSSEDIWRLHGARIAQGLKQRDHTVLFFPGGEANKRFAAVEELASQMIEHGGDRSSLVVAVGGGIVNDISGFLAAIFMRGIPVIQVPTTLLAQVDAAIGGKTGVNLVEGKNLIGSFHQPLVVLIDPEVLDTLPEREYRAGLFEIVKCGVIRDPELFDLMAGRANDVFARRPDVVDRMIGECVRIKAEVVSADEREGDLRRILNFGHTVGHALEAETGYTRFLHGEAVGFGMVAATHLAAQAGLLRVQVASEILRTIEAYGPIPALDGISAKRLVGRLQSDKKTVQGKVHFVLPEQIGSVKIVSDIDGSLVERAIEAALP